MIRLKPALHDFANTRIICCEKRLVLYARLAVAGASAPGKPGCAASSSRTIEKVNRAYGTPSLTQLPGAEAPGDWQMSLPGHP
jgi:hypothetical protein